MGHVSLHFDFNAYIRTSLGFSLQNMISLIHDPCMRFREPAGVMSDTTTALRDPIFYRWHKTCDDLGVKLKNRLRRYTDAELIFKGIKIKSFDCVDSSDKVLKYLTTFWQRSVVNLQHGLDFHAEMPSLVGFTHLNYQHFTYLWVCFKDLEAQNCHRWIVVNNYWKFQVEGWKHRQNSCAKHVPYFPYASSWWEGWRLFVWRMSKESRWNRSFPCQSWVLTSV